MSYSNIVKRLEADGFYEVFLSSVNSFIFKKEAIKALKVELEKAENSLAYEATEMNNLFQAVYNNKDLSHHIKVEQNDDNYVISVAEANCLFTAVKRNDLIDCRLDIISNKNYKENDNK